MPDQIPGYPIAKVVALTGLSERQLAYWRRIKLLSPSSRTRGGHARYDFADLVALRAAKRLLDAGVSLQRVRQAIASLRQFLPQIDQPLSEASIVATGDVLLVMHRGSRFDALSGQQWILPIADLIHELDRKKQHVGAPLQTELFPESVGTPTARARRTRRRLRAGP
jgi:DNA-binding transcriptional MerR regulator